MNNPVDVANIRAKERSGVKQFNSYEYRYKKQLLYVKTAEIHKGGKIYETLYSFTKKP